MISAWCPGSMGECHAVAIASRLRLFQRAGDIDRRYQATAGARCASAANPARPRNTRKPRRPDAAGCRSYPERSSCGACRPVLARSEFGFERTRSAARNASGPAPRISAVHRTGAGRPTGEATRCALRQRTSPRRVGIFGCSSQPPGLNPRSPALRPPFQRRALFLQIHQAAPIPPRRKRPAHGIPGN
jgi:hypothetical protein